MELRFDFFDKERVLQEAFGDALNVTLFCHTRDGPRPQKLRDVQVGASCGKRVPMCRVVEFMSSQLCRQEARSAVDLHFPVILTVSIPFRTRLLNRI